MDSVAGFFWDDTSSKSDIKASTSNKNSDDPTEDSMTGRTVTSTTTDGKMTDSKTPTFKNNTVQSSHGLTGNLGSMGQQLLAEKLVEKIIYLALPASSELAVDTIENRVEAGKNRPGLSVQIMSRNFMQLNSRLGFPFMIIDEIIKVFSWSNTSYTLCIMSFFSLAVLKPLPMLLSGPIFYLLFGVMVPQYMKIHKPDPNTAFEVNPIPAPGEPLLRATVPGPVPEFSKEFILNLTDLQNHMLIYVVVFDFINKVLASFAFFTDESVSAVAFLSLLIIALFNALFIESISAVLPVKGIILAFGWTFALAMYPANRERLFTKAYSEETRLRFLVLTNKFEQMANSYFNYYEPRERRWACILELQKFNENQKEWEPAGYSTDPYTLFSDLRIAEKSLDANAKLINDVKPPVGWVWINGSKWILDLQSVRWVEQGFIDYVEVDVETKWVYDANFDGTRGEYRRRRWMRECVRSAQDESTVDATPDEDARCYPQAEGIGHSSGSEGVGADGLKKNSHKGSSTITKSESTGSLSSTASSMSDHSNVSAARRPSASAFKSLADFLSLSQ
ncbi:LAMI_0B04170g1_1 [Lachancea mirantina]|uniref:LAMI_0B04170g1_1 n=1 Tax=Lachancea mirantina TaxID=1230905 RepID=A0A1G4IVC4_9SACH|nr:LAMI_0B04170g1_1 [Lachancea mirantina]